MNEPNKKEIEEVYKCQICGNRVEFGRLREDDDTQLYLIPEDEVDRFDKEYEGIECTKSRSELYEYLFSSFKNKWLMYRLDGGYHYLRILMEK
jgi:DNA-directed RNA polymerase subunit RPC12/RpoP